MKILYLTAYSYPEPVASSHMGRNRNQAFADAGFEMVLYTPTPSRGVTDEIRRKYKKIKLETMYDGHMAIHRFPLFREGKGAIQRAARYTLMCFIHFLKGSFAKDARECDVMFVASTPPIQGAMAAMVKKIRRIPLIYNLQDVFPDSLVNTGTICKSSILWRIGRIIEDFTYRNADKIVVISTDIKNNIIAKGVPEDKIELIYNWVDESEVIDIQRSENKLFDLYGLDKNKFYVTYCGNIGLTQNMDMLLDVAEDLEEYPDIQFVIIGDGAYKKNVEKNIIDRNLGNVKLLPFQPYEDISHVFSLGDVGLIISKPGVGDNSVPSKTWSIMSASRPVLASFDENELKDIIKNNDCGVFVPAGDKLALKEAIISLYKDRDRCVEYGRNGRKFILNNLTKEIGTTKYVNLIKSFEK